VVATGEARSHGFSVPERPPPWGFWEEDGGSRPSDLDLMANSVYRLELCSWDVRLGSDSGQSVAL
jgi:hypothetical protein